MVKVAAVFGLSGVGKSWLIARYAVSHSVMHVQASKLLRDAKAAISGVAVIAEELRTGAVLDNQQLLITSFADLRTRARQPIVFDGHCIVDNGQRLIEIPAGVVLSLGISGVVFLFEAIRRELSIIASMIKLECGLCGLCGKFPRIKSMPMSFA